MRLYIAEKPSLGKAIAENLPGVKSRDDGFIRVGTDVVTWAHGHILELAPPEAYNPAWKSWNTAARVAGDSSCIWARSRQSATSVIVEMRHTEGLRCLHEGKEMVCTGLIQSYPYI